MFTGVVTNAGATLLNRWSTEEKALIIVKASCGTGTADNLATQTSVASEAHDVSIVSKKNVVGGVKYKIQIAPASSAITVKQIGIWAKLTGDNSNVLLALFQDTTGVSIPSSTDMPDYLYNFYALVNMSNTGELTLTVDTSAAVSESTLEEAIDDNTVKYSEAQTLTDAQKKQARSNTSLSEDVTSAFNLTCSKGHIYTGTFKAFRSGNMVMLSFTLVFDSAVNSGNIVEIKSGISNSNHPELKCVGIDSANDDVIYYCIGGAMMTTLNQMNAEIRRTDSNGGFSFAIYPNANVSVDTYCFCSFIYMCQGE